MMCFKSDPVQLLSLYKGTTKNTDGYLRFLSVFHQELLPCYSKLDFLGEVH